MKQFAIGSLGLYCILILSGCSYPLPEGDWHHPLYMANQDYWRARIPVTVENLSDQVLWGHPFGMKVGQDTGELPLTGIDATAIRVVDEMGSELLCRIKSPDGALITRGSIPAGSSLVLPVSIGIRASGTYFIYFNNPSAWAVADVLESHHGISNNGFETGDDQNPFGWRLDWPSGERTVQWSSDHSHSGVHSIQIQNRVKVADKKYGARQRDIHIQGGARYRIEGWVKAEEVTGRAGWQILIGDKASYDSDFTLNEQLLESGNGTYDWKRISTEFTAPADANSARVYTMLEGTGTAWFDDIRIVCLSEIDLNTIIKPIQTKTLKTVGGKSAWHEDSFGDIRVPIKILNFENKSVKNLPVYVDLEQMLSRLHDRVSGSASIHLVEKKSLKPHLRFKTALLYDSHVSASSVKTAYAYFDGERDPESSSTISLYNEWVRDKRNLVRNPNANQGETDWERLISDTHPDDVVQELFTEELTGDVSFRIQVPMQKKTEGIGWKQEISIKPGKTYMFSSRVKCTHINSGSVSIKIKFLTKDGITLTEDANSNIVRGTTDWSIISGFFKAPEEASLAQLHLPLDAPGSVMYDGMVMMEVIEGIVSTLVFDQRKAQELEELKVWPVNPIVKVFYEDLPPEQINPARISAARNETEPLQLALRSPQAYHQLRAEIIPPKGPDGHQLDKVSLSVVGYVPINYPTNYYRTEAPYWYLKYPTGDIGSDGWTGFWPDPLLPMDTFDLPANTTQPIWIEVTIPEEAASGDYTGQIILYQKDVPVLEIPWTVHVWNFSIPNEAQFGATYDFRFPDHLRDPGPDLFRNDLNKNEFRDMYWSFMAKHKINGGEILPPPVFQYANGKVHADFTEYDKAASIYFNELKLPFVYAPSEFFYLFDWSKPPGIKFNERPYPGEYPYENADRGELRTEYKQAYQAVLRTYWNHMKEKGWADKILLYIADEPYQDENTPVDIGAQMKALSSMIHEVDEDIPIYTSTWWYHPEWEDYIDVWGLTAFGVAWGKQPVPPEDLKHVVSSGDRLWFTTDGQMCTETPYLAVERLLPLYAFKHGAEAYEFWGVNWFTFNPYEFGWQSYIFQSQAPGEAFWIRYPNGDGYIIYPGKPIGYDGLVASIRLKQVREGATDYAYLTLLEKLIQKAHADGKNVEAARDAMNQALKIAELPHDEFNSDPIEVQIFNGRYSTRLLKNPDRVLYVREQIAKQIEQLGEK